MDLDAPRLRLLQLVADRETNLAEVSRAIGKNHAYLQQYVRRGTPRYLPEEVREALAHYFRTHADEFRLGATRTYARAEDTSPDVVSIGGHDYTLLPVYDLQLPTGTGAWEGDESEPLRFEPYLLRWLRSITAAPPEMLLVARVQGDSMEPTLHNGDQVILDRTRIRATRDGIYGLRHNRALQIKRIAVDPRSGLLTVISDNSQYPSWQGVNPEDIEIFGQVIWLGRQV